MSKTKVLVVFLMLVSMPFMMLADIREHSDRFEFGASAGVGFYVGQKNPVAGRDLLRIQSYDAVAFGERSTLKWPGIETFGFSFGYRFDTRWNIKLQTTRQRVCFAEYDNEMYVNGNHVDPAKTRCVYYNAMWHLDVMAEYNLLNYGNIMMPNQRIYSVVPYIGFGLGITMANKEATLRSNQTGAKLNTFYPQVGTKGKEVAVGMYIPVSVGVKWRVNDNVQLKGTFQYQLYFSNNKFGGLSSNLEGATYVDAPLANTRPSFENLDKHITGYNHDCIFSISAIFNFGKWYEERLVTY